MERHFDYWGDAVPASPIVLSVPHAGRDYPPAVTAALTGSTMVLATLEDRHVDAVALAARTTETMLIQRRGRAWIDLNRGEDERDPRVDEGGLPVGIGDIKLRSGLGLVPRRAGGRDMIWRHRLSTAEIAARIESDHRPYHAALAAALAAARDRFGIAVLVDIHSMPSLGAAGAEVVIGDRFGRTAATALVAQAEAVAIMAGHRTALNAPYAGGHILDRHADPARGIHALQIELDRTLYLDARLDQPGDGLAATAAMVRKMLAALSAEALRPLAQAAE